MILTSIQRIIRIGHPEVYVGRELESSSPLEKRKQDYICGNWIYMYGIMEIGYKYMNGLNVCLNCNLYLLRFNS